MDPKPSTSRCRARPLHGSCPRASRHSLELAITEANNLSATQAGSRDSKPGHANSPLPLSGQSASACRKLAKLSTTLPQARLEKAYSAATFAADAPTLYCLQALDT
eukprot:614004-Amphidinium_carterae.1